VSQPDRPPEIAVDFAPPRAANRVRPLAVVVAVVLMAGVVTVAVTQLLLR
jgi:hypothetical protein